MHVVIMCVKVDRFLDIDDIFDIQCELMPIACQWRNIGQAGSKTIS